MLITSMGIDVSSEVTQCYISPRLKARSTPWLSAHLEVLHMGEVWVKLHDHLTI